LFLAKYFALEQSFWKQNEYRLGPSSQFRQIYEQLIPKVRTSPAVFNERQYWLKLSIAERTIDHVVSALRAFWIDAPADSIWSPVEPHLARLNRPKHWSEASPVDEASLHEAAVQYLEEPWMQLNIIDWYILNGFIYDELMKTSAAAAEKPPDPSGKELIIPRLNVRDSILAKINPGLATAFIMFVFIPAFMFCLYYFGLRAIAAWALLPYTIGLAIYLLALPEKFTGKRKAKQDSCDLSRKQNRLLQLYQLASASTFSPSRIAEQMEENERRGIHFDPAVCVILKNAIQRDPAVFKI
jgi:hypothetical protein